MNIYIHVEIIARELDSKLLLALCAAERGHDVVVSCHETIRFMIKRKNLFKPGIFHAKDLAPRKSKIDRHEKLINRGYKITSMDEEGRLISWDYEPFAKGRFSVASLNQASGIFCWGDHDYNELKRFYPDFKEIFHRTGSTRADLWQKKFKSFWRRPEKVPNRDFLLVSSNFGHANNYQRFWKIIKGHRKSGYFERTPDLEREKYIRFSEEILVIFEFIKALKFLAKKMPDIDIVVRPHPVEDPESWFDLIGDVENIHVIKDGAITPWVNNSFAVLHNGCTTALEAVVAEKPLITFIPFVQTYENEMPNSLGVKVSNQAELVQAVEEILYNKNGYGLENRDKEIVLKKIFYSQDELAADHMIDVWEKIGNSELSGKNDWNKIKYLLLIKNIAMFLWVNLTRVFLRRSRDRYRREFPPLNRVDTVDKVQLLKQCIGKGWKVSVEMLDRRTILFRKRS